MNYQSYVQMLKALAEPNRLKIVDLLSCGSLCACDLLQYFDFSQPTLSHHMKVLQSAGIVITRKEGKWHHYSLQADFLNQFKRNTDQLLNNKHCLCQKSKC